MYQVIKQDYESKNNTILFTSTNKLESLQFMEQIAIDFVVGKVGEKVLDKQTKPIDKNIKRGYADVKGTIERYVPRCLHRQYSIGSSNWSNMDDYFVVRDPFNSTLHKLTVMKKVAEDGWILNAEFKRIFSLDIVHQNNIYDDYDYEERREFSERYEFMSVLDELLELSNNIETNANDTTTDQLEKTEN